MHVTSLARQCLHTVMCSFKKTDFSVSVCYLQCQHILDGHRLYRYRVPTIIWIVMSSVIEDKPH